MKKKEIVVSEETQAEVPVTSKKAEFKALVKAYKKQSPAKFALKEAELEAKLASL